MFKKSIRQAIAALVAVLASTVVLILVRVMP